MPLFDFVSPHIYEFVVFVAMFPTVNISMACMGNNTKHEVFLNFDCHASRFRGQYDPMTPVHAAGAGGGRSSSSASAFHELASSSVAGYRSSG